MKVKTAKEICAAIAQNNKFDLGNKKEIKAITFGFTKLNSLIGNNYLEKGNVICLSANPGFGKSTLSLDFILNVAKISKKEIIYFTSRLTSEQIINNLIQKLSGLKLQNNIILEKERGVLFNKLKEVYNLKITILNFTGGITEIIEEMLETKRDISLIVIDDYNDLMCFEQNALIKIKALSKCFNIPMLLCGHLIKQTDKIKNQKPSMNNLGRRSIYFDIVLLLHRDAYYPTIDDNNDLNLTELLVAKNNNGEIGIVNLYFDYDNLSFRESKI